MKNVREGRTFQRTEDREKYERDLAESNVNKKKTEKMRRKKI